MKILIQKNSCADCLLLLKVSRILKLPVFLADLQFCTYALEHPSSVLCNFSNPVETEFHHVMSHFLSSGGDVPICFPA